MKKLVFIIILGIFLKPIFPVIEYIVDYDYIVNILCENKAVPEMNCNGKCHLMKELAKANDVEKPISPNKKNNSIDTVDLFFKLDCVCSILSHLGFSKNKINNIYSNLYFYLNTDLFFHPPICIS